MTMQTLQTLQLGGYPFRTQRGQTQWTSGGAIVARTFEVPVVLMNATDEANLWNVLASGVVSMMLPDETAIPLVALQVRDWAQHAYPVVVTVQATEVNGA